MSEQEFHCMYLLPRDKLEEDKEFDVVGDLSELHAKPLVEQPTNQNGGTTSHQEGKGGIQFIQPNIGVSVIK